MATFLDVTALQSFSVVFVFLFVWLFVYAILLYTKVLGSNQIINILVGVLAAFFVIMSDIATKVVKQIAPIFAVVLVLIAIVAIASKTLGSDSIGIADSHAMKYIVLVILVVALIVGALAVVRENINVPETGEDFSKTSTIIFHPNFLGMILIFLVAVFTIGLLAAKQA